MSGLQGATCIFPTETVYYKCLLDRHWQNRALHLRYDLTTFLFPPGTHQCDFWPAIQLQSTFFLWLLGPLTKECLLPNVWSMMWFHHHTRSNYSSLYGKTSTCLLSLKAWAKYEMCHTVTRSLISSTNSVLFNTVYLFLVLQLLGSLLCSMT